MPVLRLLLRPSKGRSQEKRARAAQRAGFPLLFPGVFRVAEAKLVFLGLLGFLRFLGCLGVTGLYKTLRALEVPYKVLIRAL